MLNGQIVNEFYDLADRWQGVLEQRNMERRVRQQLADFAAHTAAQFRWKEKLTDMAPIYWPNAMQQGFMQRAVLSTAFRLAWLVQRRKRSHHAALAPLCTRLSGQAAP